MLQIDPIKILCNHLISENHTKAHKLTVGVFVMIIGVVVSKCVLFLEEGSPFAVVLDGGGYLIHGIGTLPFVELILKIGRTV